MEHNKIIDQKILFHASGVLMKFII